MITKIFSLAFLVSSAYATCQNPKVQASSYTPADSQVLSSIPYIAEFTLDCSNGEKPILFADIEGALVPVTQSMDGSKYQVSWTKVLKKAATGDYSVPLYDSDGYTAVRRSRERGEASATAPLVTIVISYNGSYSGPWVSSEHLFLGLASLVFYLAFSSKSKLMA